MKHYCVEDYKDENGAVLCTKGKVYDIVSAPEDPDSGYCDIVACDDGCRCNTNWLEVGPHFTCIAKFMVVEVTDREIGAIFLCDTLDEAVEAANNLLEKHIKSIGYMDAYEDQDGEDDEWQRAAADKMFAWCNWRQNWDAHIIEL